MVCATTMGGPIAGVGMPFCEKSQRLAETKPLSAKVQRWSSCGGSCKLGSVEFDLPGWRMLGFEFSLVSGRDFSRGVHAAK